MPVLSFHYSFVLDSHSLNQLCIVWNAVCKGGNPVDLSQLFTFLLHNIQRNSLPDSNQITPNLRQYMWVNYITLHLQCFAA